jgi:hypothetical protein
MKSTMRSIFILITMLSGIFAFAQAVPPSRINYQGVLRDSSGNPLSGSQTMTFRLYDSISGGTLLWEETYSPSYSPQVTVSSGLFTVALGDPAHRTSGSETLFPNVFALHSGVYLSVAVGPDNEMTPRIQVVSAPFAENADTLDGKHSSSFLDASLSGNFIDTSSTTQIKAGKLILSSPDDFGLQSYGAVGGGYFYNPGSGIARLGYGNYGIQAFGSAEGGFFQNLTSSGYAHVAFVDVGIDAHGSTAGGYFHGPLSGYANVGAGHYGIAAYGNSMGGWFADLDSSGFAWAGYGDEGIHAEGNTVGGFFKDKDHSGHVNAGWGDIGVEAYGNAMGGYFQGPSAGSQILATVKKEFTPKAIMSAVFLKTSMKAVTRTSGREMSASTPKALGPAAFL